MGLGVGIFLVAIGAILKFAISVNTNGTGIDLQTIGLILLIVGIVAIVLSLAFWSSWAGPGYWSRSRRTTTVAPGATTSTTTVDQP